MYYRKKAWKIIQVSYIPTTVQAVAPPRPFQETMQIKALCRGPALMGTAAFIKIMTFSKSHQTKQAI